MDWLPRPVSELMSLIITSYDRIIVNGDFNIHVNKTIDARARSFVDVLDTLELKQHVTGSTHNHGNTLDLVISRGIEVTDLSVSDINMSDHYCVYFNLILNALEVHPETTIESRLLDTRAEQQFIIFADSINHSIDQMVEAFNSANSATLLDKSGSSKD